MTRSKLPDLRDMHRVLIIRLSSIGDVTHALPVSAALGEAFPHLEISWLVEEMSAPVVEGNPFIKEVIVVPKSRWKEGWTCSTQIWREYLGFLKVLRQRQFDLILDLQGYAPSGLMALATGAPNRFGWSIMREGAGSVSSPVFHRVESVHRVDWFMDVVRAFGLEPKDIQFPLHIPNISRKKVHDPLSAGGISPEQHKPSGWRPRATLGCRPLCQA